MERCEKVCGSTVGIQGSWWGQIVGGSVVGGSAGRELMGWEGW